MAQTPAHVPSTQSDARIVSITGMDIEMEGCAFGEPLEQEEGVQPLSGD